MVLGAGLADALLVGRQANLMYLVCYLRDGDRVFETYWTTRRGVEAMDNSYALMDLTVYGRQEGWEDSPVGWPQPWEVDGLQLRTNGRPTAQWSRSTPDAPTTSARPEAETHERRGRSPAGGPSGRVS